MTLTFGSPHFDGFILWGFWAKGLWSEANGAAFFTNDWSPTPVYQAWKDQMAKWTVDEQLKVGPDGTIAFNAFFGDYEITVDGKTIPFKLISGTNEYTLKVK